MAKVVYFTRSPQQPDSPPLLVNPANGVESSDDLRTPEGDVPPGLLSSHTAKLNGALTPKVLESHQQQQPSQPLDLKGSAFQDELVRRASLQHLPGGSLNFERFETDNIDDCVAFIKDLVERSAKVNGVSIKKMRDGVKIMATGGGAHKFHELFSKELGVEFLKEDEMECLIVGLKVLTLIPNEVYTFSDQLAQAGSSAGAAPLDRPSPNPPQYQVVFQDQPSPQLPCLLVNIGSGVSIVKVNEDGTYERISGTSLGGGTLWGLLSLLTPATSFDGTSSIKPVHQLSSQLYYLL